MGENKINFSEKPIHIYLFISSWTMNFIFGILLYWQILACLYFSRVCFRSMTLFIIYWKSIFLIENYWVVFEPYERHRARKETTVFNTKHSECVHWAGRRPSREELGCVSSRGAGRLLWRTLAFLAASQSKGVQVFLAITLG